MLQAPIKIEANLESPDGISDSCFDKMAAIKCNYNLQQKYEVTRMYVSKPGWYHTIILPINTSDLNSNKNTDEAMQLCESTTDSQNFTRDTKEAMQNSMCSCDTYNLQANCNDQESNQECTINNDHSNSQLTNATINSKSSYVNGTVESHVTEISPDGKCVSISITITLSDT